jgi:hypothetical protein
LGSPWGSIFGGRAQKVTKTIKTQKNSKKLKKLKKMQKNSTFLKILFLKRSNFAFSKLSVNTVYIKCGRLKSGKKGGKKSLKNSKKRMKKIKIFHFLQKSGKK